MDENHEMEHSGENAGAGRSTHSTRAWRACCLAPSLALALILIVAMVAGLSGRGPWGRRSPAEPAPSASAKKAAFATFGRSYFQIAARADTETGRAYKILHAYSTGKRKISHVHDAFKKAALANDQASREYRALAIPAVLTSREKLQHSVVAMSQAYRMRRTVCETVESWSGRLDDKAMMERYSSQTGEVKRLTEEGVSNFASAAYENGLTNDDIRGMIASQEVSTGDILSSSSRNKE